ncbi:sensor histidine kinase [Deinococcus pimensis]|uniref:sensor histidine kinase n=1 Tax=Deinococcus pimensis TaxID=309888 RepID=UPI000488111B|nr:HAMP domain-containing sensor histidine kinase [Deinococcus pimensis]
MTLRFRLALVYSLIAFVLVAALAGTGTYLLTREVNRQFETRLAEQAQYVRSLIFGSTEGLGNLRSSGGALVVVAGPEGNVLVRSQNLGALEPLIVEGRQVLDNGQSVRGVVVPLSPVPQPGVDSGSIWVGLPDDAIVATQRSAWQFLFAGLIVAPALMLIVGWFVGRYLLRGLANAARVAERLDPSVGSIPLPRRQDEVYRLLEAINRLLGRIEAQKQSEKALLGQIVHELGAPLTAIKAYLERAAVRTGDEEVRRAQGVAEELAFTTQDLMQLARGQRDLTLALHFLPASQLRERLDRLVPGTLYTGDWRTMVLCDPDRLVQALRNLLANARRAVGPSGRVQLDLSGTPEGLRFEVSDDGPGLPAELGERIFDPFVSGSGSSGLGLSVARQIAQLHGGELTGGNAEAGGAVFVLTIPDVMVGDEDEDEDVDAYEDVARE